MTTIRFEPNGVVIETYSKETVLDAARRAGVRIHATCGGEGRCGRCQVRIDDGAMPPAGRSEQVKLTGVELEAGWRLACQFSPPSSLVVHVPHITFDGLFKSALGVADTLEGVELKPAVIRQRVELDRPTLQDNRSDAARLLDALAGNDCICERIHIQALRQLPWAIRQAEGQAEVWVRGSEVIGVYPQTGTIQGPFGLAYDVGTTTVAAYLVDLTSGALLGASSAGNTQAEFGADVMTRIDQAGRGRLDLLQARVVEVMNGLASRLCQAAAVEPAAIADITAVGNTCMTHLLLGVLPTHLGLAPYVPAFLQGVSVAASTLGLRAHPAAELVLLPNIGGFVGADTVGMMLASGIDESEETLLLLDIGTNAEIVLGSRQGMIATSTAAGPAFEGACITHGMPAAPGAISHVTWRQEDLHIQTIDDEKARGLAGSGLVSAAAALRQAGLLDANGLLNRERLAAWHWFSQETGQGTIELASREQSATSRPVLLTEEDLAQLQLARAAMAAGLAILFEESGLSVGQIDGVLLAGAFGNYMDHDDAAVIGLFPPTLRGKARGIGNAAGAGAVRALVNVDERARARQLAAATRYVELSARADFNHHFVASLPFPKLPDELPCG